jgi:hypothetical protein
MKKTKKKPKEKVLGQEDSRRSCMSLSDAAAALIKGAFISIGCEK